MQIKKLIVGGLKTNCYLIIDSTNVIIVDPGDDAQFIIENIEKLNLNPISIIATHGHFDHILAIFELKLTYSISFLMHIGDDFLLKRMSSSSKHFLGFDPGPSPTVDKYLKEGDILRTHEGEIEVVETPGHTPGGICLYSKKEKFVICGDLIFSDGSVGRYDFRYSDKDVLLKSMKKVLRWDSDTLIFPGHGKEFKLREFSKVYLK